LATVEDLVEEMLARGTRQQAACARRGREPDGRIGHARQHVDRQCEDLLGVHFGDQADEAVTTIAGLLSHVSGKVPAPGDKVDIKEFDLKFWKLISVRFCGCASATPSGYSFRE